MTPRRLGGAGVGLLALAWLLARPISVAAVTPIVSMTLAPSVAVAVDGTTVTWTSTITPISGTPFRLDLEMQSQQWFMVSVGSTFVPAGGTCTPAPDCSVDSRTGNPSWTFATLASPVTITFTTLANATKSVTLWITNDGVGCTGTCPPSATVGVPTLSVGVAYSTSGPVLTGSTLHVTVTGATNAGPLDADIRATLSGGLSEPTNISPASATFAPSPYDYIDDATTLNKAQTLRFDVQVTASAGSDVTLTAHVYQLDSRYGNPMKSVKVHVGPAATPTPTPTAGHMAGPTSTPPPASNRPTLGPTATPAAATKRSASPSGASIGAASPSPTSSDTAASTDSPMEIALVGSARPGATVVAATVTADRGSGSDTPVGAIVGVAALGLVGGLSLSVARRGRSGHR